MPVGILLLLVGLGVASQASAASLGASLSQTLPSKGGSYESACGAEWNIVPSPGGSANASMSSVVVISPTDIWAVGSQTDAATLAWRTFTMHWDGSSWTTIPSPNIGTGSNELMGAAAASSTDVWAVGRYYDPAYGATRNLILRWNGGWSVVPAPNYGKVTNFLLDVTALAPNNVWAVGGYATVAGSSLKTQVLHWNGTGWGLKSSPNTPAGDNALHGISAFSPSNMWAVGVGGSGQTLTLHWNGGLWSIVTSPVAGSYSQLESVSTIPGTSEAMAVGYFRDGTRIKPLALLWRSGAWRVTTAPTPSTAAYFSGVTAVAANEVWAVGTTGATDGPLTARWDGSNWAIVPGAGRGVSNGLSDVAAVGPDDIWAAGAYEDTGANTYSLIEHYICK